MDGTVYLSDTLIDGASELVSVLSSHPEKEYLFFSNNASRTAAQYAAKLSRLGCHVPEEKILTAGDVTAQFLLQNHPGARIFLNGTKELADDWRSKGLLLTDDHPDIAVQSFDLSMTYERMEKICRFIREGALFYATHPDINCPVEGGFIPDCGAMCALISASTGKTPVFFGKPSAQTVDRIEALTGIPGEQIAFVGDRIYTDIAAGIKNGAKGILVLTGETDEEMLRRSDIRPDAVFTGVKELAARVSEAG
ncbi:MAG: HAD-IIA family hydrolase [Lachnospiraceae bacterium]|nr:HAD-IIA family hydrolase [Lachnospiraceae bacterium]